MFYMALFSTGCFHISKVPIVQKLHNIPYIFLLCFSPQLRIIKIKNLPQYLSLSALVQIVCQTKPCSMICTHSSHAKFLNFKTVATSGCVKYSGIEMNLSSEHRLYCCTSNFCCDFALF